MSTVRLHVPQESDWPLILGLANAAVPWDADGNREWLQNRKDYRGRRRHYLAEERASGRVTGYGALEEGPDDGSFRLFVVMNPALLKATAGELIYDRLAADLLELNAQAAWVREYAADKAILEFFEDKGFTEEHRFAPLGEAGMVVLLKRLR